MSSSDQHAIAVGPQADSGAATPSESESRMFFRGIRYTDTMLPVLRNAGFNTVFFDNKVNQALITEAADLGMWIAPEFRVMTDDRVALAPEEITKQVNRYSDTDAVLFRRLQDFLHFVVEGFASQQQPSGGMRNNLRVRILNRSKQPLGHFPASQAHI